MKYVFGKTNYSLASVHLKRHMNTFFISNAFISNARLKLAKKIKQKLSNTLRLSFHYLKTTRLLHPRYRVRLNFWKMIREFS